MEDIRIIKTKNRIQQAFIEMLQTKAFDRINVTELCQKAQISRITFYAHYHDKYDLLKQIEEELLKQASQSFESLQAQNNEQQDARQTYQNMLDCILSLFTMHGDFLQQISQRRNPELFYSFYQRILDRVISCIETEQSKLKPKVNSRRFSAFICNGLWAYIVECYHDREELEQIRIEAHTLLDGILHSEIMNQSEEVKS